MKRLRNCVLLTLIVFFASTITACAEMYKKPTDDKTDKFVYSIQFNAASGKLEVLDKEGQIIRGKPINFPEEHLPVNAIINVHTIIEAKGSCLIIFNRQVFNICR
ncbi:MAG: hypothetical protein AB2565_19580 [Candidatus Thiodiazotropha endolucinida]|uniref:Uncharacterized protein n=2 Tax=Candidatus Thiodiazotropha TaxID=1913444 RepID=A0A7Z0VHR1_9GAMM|nr:hypothetical protein [Candidatus Thiodiazotropha endolucinida]MCG7976832.1 hypothetical protein [Candidatus Thiodiazotropha taylori]MCG8049556.1 hypothetical protein [Candidatus Thiodiazotropha taylori]MCG8061110.1 hypothetical protein [Candidatus Thiodiazotropha taylori]MCG8071093.1 hypothetical protein [Candidatus Thiodiazotropha taylori]MCG8095629.1 hypothetical protein [Candidatus Thiodiazotropha endolucinida]